MAEQPCRLRHATSVVRSAEIPFYFNGRKYTGCKGDTLASALLANAISLVGRSFKYHAPRGIVSHALEEPNALLSLKTPKGISPNTRATDVELTEGLESFSQKGYPSLRYDLGAVAGVFSSFLAAGFYYKTFIGPGKRGWRFFEPPIRNAAGLGRASSDADLDWYEHMNLHVDVAIVGAGPYGLRAAEHAARAGKRCVLFEADFALGGHLLSCHGDSLTIDGLAPKAWVERQVALLKSLNVIILPHTVVTGWYQDRYLVAQESVNGYASTPRDAPRERLWRVRAKHVVLATGAIERPLLFANNDRPGVLLADSLRTYAVRFGVLVGSEVVIATNNDSGYRAAVDIVRCAGDRLHSMHVVDSRAEAPEVETEVETEVKTAPDTAGYWQARARANDKITIHTQSVVVAAHGRQRIRKVSIRKIADPTAHFVQFAEQSPETTLRCTALGMSGGFTPTLHLLSQSGQKLAYSPAHDAFLASAVTEDAVTEDAVTGAAVVGAAAGHWGLAPLTAPMPALWPAAKTPPRAKQRKSKAATPPIALAGDDDSPLSPARIHFLPNWETQRHFVDFQNDVKLSDLELARREGYGAIEHLKRYTTTGMATDQGKTSNVNAIQFLAARAQIAPPSVGHTTFRPPYVPVSFGALTGAKTKLDFRPTRTSSLYHAHIALDAVFENVGEWKRAHYYPKRGETMAQAVQRECLAVREAVGIYDASTLGKIDIYGADSAWFLDWVYSNRFSTLQRDRCRYGLMLNENGMIFDDGVTTRLGENHYHMTTTSGGALSVLNWLEQWRQLEWPEKQVWFTSVTEYWAVIAIAGPKARGLLGKLTPLDLSSDAFPFMQMRETTVADIPCRIFRISFSGEVGFEVNVPALQAKKLWSALLEQGKDLGVTPYGTEAMHVLRAEKGFIVLGQDTDGTCTPDDVGLGHMVSKRKHDFLGARSLTRAAMQLPGRKQLVGFTTELGEVIPEGSPVCSDASLSDPSELGAEQSDFTIEGHITSSYIRPRIGTNFGLAMIKNGRRRLGTVLYAPLETGSIPLRLCSAVFSDPDNQKQA